MVELREHERRTLQALKKLGGKASVEQLVENGLSDAAAMRAALTLQEKGLVRVDEEKQSTVALNDEGKLHARNGLPERRLVTALERLGGTADCDTAFRKAGLEKQFIPIALGWAQRKKWTILDSKASKLQSTQKPKEGADERLLKLLVEREPVVADSLDTESKEAVQILKRRKLLNVEDKTRRIVHLTETGWTAVKKKAHAVLEVTQLTQELIVSGKWRKVKLQKYNIEAPVAKTWPGKKHPYVKFLEEVRRKLVALGFKEMVGTAVETAFFNFDALYTPQDHPARELSGIYYIKSPTQGKIEAYRKALSNVKKTHENGWKTGSTGWRYDFSTEEAKRLILRGHGTCLSARTLLSKDLEIPGRYFSIARCYRPEIVDRTHLTEFNQVEGIVVDRDLTLGDLLGILEKFAFEVAEADRIKFKPDYFPFTEPSVELNAYRKGYGWIEFGGSGIFRPEVTLPLGIKDPVIAWGLGIDRLFMMRARVEEIRYIFSNDLDWIRKKEVV